MSLKRFNTKQDMRNYDRQRNEQRLEELTNPDFKPIEWREAKNKTPKPLKNRDDKKNKKLTEDFGIKNPVEKNDSSN